MAIICVERRQPASDAIFASRIADEHFVLHNDRRHCHRLADVDVSNTVVPYQISAHSIQGNRVPVELVVEYAPV